VRICWKQSVMWAMVLAFLQIFMGGCGDTGKKTEFSTAGVPSREDVRSIYYVSQLWSQNDANEKFIKGKSLSCGAYERWFYYPEGIDGPMFHMVQRWDPNQKIKYCSWMESGEGLYKYGQDRETVWVRGRRCPPLGNNNTTRLPSDSAEFTQFLDEVEGKMDGVEYIRDRKSGLLLGSVDNRFANAQNFRSAVIYNSFDANIFDWPKHAKQNDTRDEAHKRGWTCYRIKGVWGGKSVEGIVRMPFVYSKAAEHPPVLKIKIGDDINIIDTPAKTFVTKNGRTVLYPKGNFFKGLSKPWMGMHTVDSLRRDAAEKRIRFDFESVDANVPANGMGKVGLNLYKDKKGSAKITYVIDIDKDVIEKIELTSHDGKKIEGMIMFIYPDDVEALDKELEKVQFKEAKSSRKDGTGIRWLMELCGEE